MATEFVVLKMCVRCRAPKTLEEFPRSKRMADGRHSYCRKCAQEYQREWLARNPDKRARIRERARERYHEQRNERVVAARMQRRARNAARTQRKNTVEPYLPVSKLDVIDAEPFAHFVTSMFPDWSMGELAAVLMVPERRLREIIEYGHKVATLDLIDRALTVGLGRPDLLNTLYPVDTEHAA